MPTDRHGVIHTGTVGLFDDDDELRNAQERAERHERERLETQIRRQLRRDEYQERKDARAADRGGGRSKLLWPCSWLGRLFGGEKKPSADAVPSKDDGDKPITGIRKTIEYIVVRKPLTPEVVYTAEDVDPVDSPWLRECSLLRVKSDDASGCHIVPKSSIQKSA